MEILLANIVDPDQMPHYVASDLGLHCLLMTLLQVSKLEWVSKPIPVLSFQGEDAQDKQEA